DYVTYQEAANRFPEIPIEQFKRAVAFIEPDGQAFFAAEAVYRPLRCRSSRRWLAWSYDRVPGFAAASELAYKFIARHRGAGSVVAPTGCCQRFAGSIRATYFFIFSVRAALLCRCS